MNLEHLRYFYEVAREGSVSRAAKKLRISQPAVTRMIHLLESHLEMQLFERNQKGTRLTAAGAAVLERCERILEEARLIEDLSQPATGALRGNWGMGASDNLMIHKLPQIIAKFSQVNPDLKFKLFSGTSGEIKEEILVDRCEVGLFYSVIRSHEPFDSEILHEAEFLLTIAAKNPWLKKAFTLRNLKAAQIPLIGHRVSDYQGDIAAHRHLEMLGISTDAQIEINQHEAQIELVKQGAGFALLLRHAIEDEIKKGSLVVIPAPKRSAPIFWVRKKGRQESRAAIQFKQRLRADFQART